LPCSPAVFFDILALTDLKTAPSLEGGEPIVRVKNLSLPILILLISIFLAGSCRKADPPFQCNDTLGCVNIQPGNPIKIGVLQELAGEVAPLGIEQIRGIQLAIEDHNGKVLGRSLDLQTEEAGCSAEGGANAVLKVLADPQTVAILGTTCSGSARTASAAMSEAGLTMVSGNNSAPFLTSIGGKAAPNYHPGYFRTAPNEEYSGKAAAIYAYQKLSIRKAATINDGDIYTTGLTVGFIEKFKSLGGEIVLSASINKGDTDMRPILDAVNNSGAQLLFFPLFQPEGNHILLQARALPEFEKIVLMSDGALIQMNFLDAVKDKGKGMYFVGPSFPQNAASEALTKKYVAKFAISPGTNYFLSAYDSANLLFHGIEKASHTDRNGVLHIGRQALRNALHDTSGFPGVTGNLSCDSFGDCAAPTFNILRLDNPAAGIQGLQANAVFTFSPNK
jgi:branched-chain amino acid transport system substrate-binding protein